MPAKVLTAEIFAAVLRDAWNHPNTYQQGHALVAQRRVTLQHLERQAATVRVTDQRGHVYTINVSHKDDQFWMACDGADCLPQCAHRLAAAQVLYQKLQAEPFFVWQQALQAVVRTPKPRQTRSGNRGAAIVFSLQPGGYSGRHVAMYSVSASELPADCPVDGPELARAIHRAGSVARPVYTRNDFSSIRNASSELIAAAGLLQSPGAYYGQENILGTLMPLLARCPVFLGTQNKPLGKPLTVAPEAGVPELITERTPDGISLSLQVHLGEQALLLAADKTEVVGHKPLWLLQEQTLFRLNDSVDLVLTFLSNPGLVIPTGEEEEFLNDFLVPLAERMPVHGDFGATEEIRETPVPRVYLGEGEGELRVVLRFAYGTHELPYTPEPPASSFVRLDDGLTLAKVIRQPATEDATAKVVAGSGLKRTPEPGVYALRKSVSPVDLLLHQVPKLVAAGCEIYGEEALTTARVNRSTPRLSLNVSSGIDWFDVGATVQYGDTEVSFKDFRRALRKREQYIKLADGTIGVVPEEWRERFARLFGMAEETDTGLRLARTQLTVLEALLQEADQSEVDEEFHRRCAHLRHFEGIAHREVASGFQGELRPYQQAGVDWLYFLHDYGFGGCLADDMGTGKTIQALAFLLSLKESGHADRASLVVMPRSLLFNWQREAERFAPELRVLVHADGDRHQTAEVFNDYDLVLTTYGVMLRDLELLRQYQFHYLILDESQTIKNPICQTARAARLLVGDHRLVLTGTPVENNVLELWSQFAFVNPGFLGGLEHFRNSFATSIERREDDAAADTLRRMVFPFILRRTKEQVAGELPPRTERVLTCEMEPAQRRMYAKARDYYRDMLMGLIDDNGINNARMKVLEGLLRLRQICNHPRLVDSAYKGSSAKYDELLEMLDTLRAEGHKALIFSQFTSMLGILRGELEARNIPYVYLDGQTRDRAARVDEFQNDPKIPFFLISLKAGGLGLNLTAADYVIHIDPWWNPAVEMQATDRAHRIGQDKPVFVYKLIVKDTVEEKILQLQDRKRELVEQLIQTEGSMLKSLTREDVAVLFG